MDDDYVLSNLAMALSASHQPETTALSSADEAKFQAWVKANGLEAVDAPDAHYDMRGYWQNVASKGRNETAINVVDRRLHFPDTYKQHGHPTFSTESQYSRGPQDGGQWIGDALVPPPLASHAPTVRVTPISVMDTASGAARELNPLPSHGTEPRLRPSH